LIWKRKLNRAVRRYIFNRGLTSLQEREGETKATTTQDPQEPVKRARAAGCGSFLVFKLVTVSLLVGFGLHRADEAGVSLDVMVKQPALAVAAIGVMARTDYEFVSLDKYRGTLTLRVADTGQTSTLRPEQVLRGEVLESGRTIGNLLGDSESATGMLAWVPAYPGATSRGVVRQDSPGLLRGVASFETFAAPPAQIANHYEQALSDAGLEVSRLSENSTITVSAKNSVREAKVVLTAQGAICNIRITFSERL
jgi:hypothetical protein